MAEFSGKIASAVFVDAEYSIIKVRYEDNNGNLAVYNLEANPDSQDYKDLVDEGWDQERIIEETSEFKKAQSAAFNIEVQAAAKEMIGILELEKQKSELEKTILDMDHTAKKQADTDKHVVWDSVISANEDKDELFKFKLWALEQDIVKNAPKEIKSSIRKAKRITTALKIYDSLLD